MPLPPMADIARSDPPPRPTLVPPPAVKIDPVPEPGVPEPKIEPKIEPRTEPRPEPAVAMPPPPPRKPDAPKPSLFGGLFGSKRTPVAAIRKEAAPAPAEPARVDLGPLTTVPEREPAVPPLRPALPPVPADNGAAPPAPPAADAGAQVYKSGVINGMAYTLYVDGSIEAELPQGRIRFASVEELQKYLSGRSA
jgi:hypothetical protein